MAHIHEKYDFVISVFIVYGDKVLLVNHPRYNKWISMGGHIELDEDPDQAVFREVKEETGLDIEIIGPKPPIMESGVKVCYTPRYIDVHQANLSHKHIGLVYYAVSKTNKHILSSEHTAIAWLSVDDLEDQKYDLSKSVKFYCKEALVEARNHT
jgi:8-oxo-dGTP pyrophosphatase MutT (NUDIX family)